MLNFAAKKFVPGLVLGVFCLALLSGPALAQLGTTPVLEKPAAPPEEKKEETPTTCGPLISDTCNPIETHHASLQWLAGYAFTRGFANQNWRQVSAGGNFGTFLMPVKFTYGPTKNVETYVIVPYIHNFASSVDSPPEGVRQHSADFGGIGDITAVGKYLFHEETPCTPALTAVGGVGFPAGHASHLGPKFLSQDAIGSGAFTFTTGVNLFKYLKPFLVHGQIWYNTPVNLYESRPDAVRSRDFVTFNLATEYPLTKAWVLLFEFYSTWTWTNISTPQGFQSPSTLFGVLPGIEYFISEKWALSAGSAFDLAGKSTALKITPMFTVYRNF